jgi:GSH-dependent disulfide-bond oxidoreductase
MIELVSGPSVYGQKVHIVLEETGLPYVARKAGDASATAMNPLGRTPSLHDPHGPDGLPITLGESAAIALYLARKAKKLGPESAREMAEFDYWAFAIAASLSPQFAVAFYLDDHTPERADWARDAFMENARRMLRVFEERMATRHFMAGERFTILDALLYPHLVATRRLPGDLGGLPNLERYRERIGQREAVKRGMAVLTT